MNQLINSKRRLAHVLGVGGLLPFVLGLLVLAYAPGQMAHLAERALLGWSVVILSFLGGAQWGGLIERPDFQPQALALSVLPALVAWGALFMPSTVMALLVLAIAFAATRWLDRLSAWPRWFAHLRTGLTVVVVAVLLTAAVVVWRA